MEEVKPKRCRRKSYRLQLHDTVRHIDKAIESDTLREEKKADLLIHKTEILTKLLEMDAARKHDAAVGENEELRARVRELERQGFQPLPAPERDKLDKLHTSAMTLEQRIERQRQRIEGGL